MEVILAIATLLGGATAVWFIAEKVSEARDNRRRPSALPPTGSKPLANAPTVVQPASRISGATQSGRQPFFIGEPFDKLLPALVEARQRSMPVFLVTYDPRHPTKSKLHYSLGCFLDYFTTKRLVEDHFVTALVPATDPDVAPLVPEDDPLENSLWVVLSPDKEVLRREGVYANPDEGLKRVRQVIAQTSSA